jgi:hypothetical protein
VKFECGCLAEPTGGWDRCDVHAFWVCHLPDRTATANECPPCRLARLRRGHALPIDSGTVGCYLASTSPVPATGSARSLRRPRFVLARRKA